MTLGPRLQQAQALTAPERLRLAVRPEFDVDVFRPTRGDRVFWPACPVHECNGPGRHLGMCRAHGSRLLVELGKKTGEVGDDEVRAFVERQNLGAPPTGAEPPAYSFAGLPPVLADEARLALQGMSDAGGGATDPPVFARTTRVLRELGVQSAFDLSRTTAWDIVVFNPVRGDIDVSWYPTTHTRGRQEFTLLRKMMRASAIHHAPVPLQDRMVWYPHDFGRPTQAAGVHGIVFYSFRLPWMVEWAKRWVGHEIRLGIQEFSSLVASVTGIRHLDNFLASRPDCPTGIADITQDHLERFLLWLRAEDGPGIEHGSCVNVVTRVRALLHVHRDWGWEPELRPEVFLERGRVPKPNEPVPRPLDAQVLEQLTSGETLAELEPWLADALVITRHHGLRPSSVVTLPLDCLRFNGEGETLPVLIYRNVKRGRAAEQPITQQTVIDAIRRQQDRVRNRYGDTCPWLFPSQTTNADGGRHRRGATLQKGLNLRLQTRLDVRDRDGSKFDRLTWGQFRDTRATELLNAGVPPTMVAAWLNHNHLSSIRHYCKVQTETLRRAMRDAPLIDLRGEDVTSEAAGRDVEALRQMVRQATNAVPGGVCTLPMREACPHLNRCYSCERFATTPEHLPELLGHLQSSDTLAMAHEQNGRRRMAEAQRRNVTDLRNVVRTLARWVLGHPDQESGIEEWVKTNRATLEVVAESSDE